MAAYAIGDIQGSTLVSTCKIKGSLFIKQLGSISLQDYSKLTEVMNDELDNISGF